MRGRRLDWALGILLGLVLGLGVVVAFLIFGSEGTVDAPRIHGVDGGRPAQSSTTPQSPPLGPVKE